MKQKKLIATAPEVINQYIELYQMELIYQLELRAEAEFKNGNLKITSYGDYESKIQKYEIILADLATLKRAINNNKISVKIFGSAKNRGYIYIETSRALVHAGFYLQVNELGETVLVPYDEWEKELEEGLRES